VLAATIATHVGAKLDLRDAIVLARAYINRGIRLSEALGPYRVIQHSYDEMVLVDMPKLCYQANLIGQQFSFPKCPQRLGIYPIVDSSNWVGKLIDEGINTIQLRVKNKTEPVVKREITASIQQCTENIAFFVNDYWQLAIESGAYGVHLGQEDLHDASIEKIAKAGLRLGVSTHSYWELARALAINPSYIALGPVYETTSKKMPWIPQGVDRVSQWTKLLGDAYPLVAIGGINVERAQNLKSTRVGSVAMISAITQAVDYKKATRDLIDCWSN
jgi:hydroxymethylpyrimidine kinase/phosphomethylpyrimidine kinase/thiamine-phosphate diphosphorylase